MRFFLALSLSCLMMAAVSANPAVWSDISLAGNKLAKQSKQERWLNLDHATMLERLKTAPSETSESRLKKPTLVLIDLPLPTGVNVTVQVEDSPVMEQGLADKYPQIKTWKVKGVENEVMSGRIDVTPSGFHAMLSLTNGETVLIDPKSIDGTTQYLSHQYDAHKATTHSCSFRRDASTLINTDINNKEHRSLLKVDSTLYTYRLALATTGEYTQYFGSTEKALAAVVTTLNRVNEIYERDLAIRLILIAENNQLIYPNADSDPYTNSDADLMSDQNQNNLNSVIGVNNYDIGHVFGTNGGGIATFASACQNNIKGNAATGLISPVGDMFNFDFVAHELGHQLGADHSFNGIQSSCKENNQSTAVEPGSGSTIMGYAGICGSDNLQSSTDAVFHYGSIQEIRAFSREGKGASCAKKVSLGNSPPVVTAAANKTIPARTPFLLKGSATDIDLDPMTYAWDQMDVGTQSNVDVDTGNNAIIRSYLPTANAERMIPKLSDLIAGTKTKGEMLPTTTRSLNFKLVVRDGKGGVGEDDLTLTVEDTGSAFAITSNTSAASLNKGQSIDVTWNVANTDASPINCSTVDIALSNDGNTFTTLKTQRQNDGHDTIVLPNNIPSPSTAYIRVTCSDNIFFAIAPLTGSLESNENENVLLSNSGGGSFLPQYILFLLMFAGFIIQRAKVLK